MARSQYRLQILVFIAFSSFFPTPLALSAPLKHETSLSKTAQEAIQGRLLGLYPDFLTAQSLICDPSLWPKKWIDGRKMEGKILQRFKDAGGHSLESVGWENQDHSHRIHLYFNSNRIERIVLEKLPSFFLLHIEIPEPSLERGPRRILAEFGFVGTEDNGCQFQGGRHYEYRHNLLWKLEILNASGKVMDSCSINQRPKYLPELTEQLGLMMGKTPTEVEEAIRFHAGLHRTRMALLDSGVDYNHALLALFLDRPDEPRRKTIETRMARLRLEIEDKKRRLEQLGALEKFFRENSFQKTLLNLESELETQKRLLMEVSLGWDFIDDDGEPFDTSYFSSFSNLGEDLGSDYHGTTVAGVIAREGRDEASILPIRFSFNTPEDIEAAIAFAERRGARVINASIGITDDSGTVTSERVLALKSAIQSRSQILFVVAAGNGDENGQGIDLDQNPLYPASFRLPNLITVGSVSPAGNLSSFSNYGKETVHFVAPGEQIETLAPGNQFVKADGTSVAAPYVAALAGRILYINPKLNPEEVVHLLRLSVTSPRKELEGKSKYPGLINVNKALDLAKRSLIR